MIWDKISVEAHLSKLGELVVSEVWQMDFDGDWNGGERYFNILPGNKFQLLGLDVWDGEKWDPLTEGDLREVNNYHFKNSKSLRWRARYFDDPPFSHTKLSYRLRYSYSNILYRQDDDHFLLKHNFLIDDRQGVVKDYELKLTADPAWTSETSFPIEHALENVEPGVGHEVQLKLQSATPQLVEARNIADPIMAYATGLGGAGIIILVLTTLFVRREGSLGRWSPASGPSKVTPEFIEAKLLSLKPEAAGVLWDDWSSGSEIAAWFARMDREGKIKTTLHEVPENFWKRLTWQKARITIELAAPRTDFLDWEMQLIEGFFPDGATRATDVGLRSYYRSTRKRFYPMTILEEGVMAAVPSQHGAFVERPALLKALLSILVASFVLLRMWSFIQDEANFGYAFLWDFAMVIPGALVSVFSFLWFRRQLGEWYRLLGALVVLYLPTLFILFSATDSLVSDGYPMYSILATQLAGFAALTSITILGLTSSSSTLNALRMDLHRIRLYLKQQLESAKPAIKDDWYPWLLALGLSKEMDKWFSSFSAFRKTSSLADKSLSGMGLGSNSTWTGGGGQFAGAGATGSWSNFSSTVGSGLTSSASAGSSSKRSGSSGGGGGGGW